MSGDMARAYITDDYDLYEQFNTMPPSWWFDDDANEIAREQAERWRAAEADRAEARYWGEASKEMLAVMSERRNRQIAERRGREEARRAEIRAGLYGKGTP
ncbi:hypothetical protein [Actinacidiphila acididurans]|uniref:Uncharacterized protein n=1 Tax=Actinacidiphila acididurans TaxID=2784346 RepID=A0ABS2U4A0_9ACTN|nr:hypothetical protein [Actinacidiphila acididurans]MBM9509971.1 hypothetical protein [Actinacidiphila acididurans]